MEGQGNNANANANDSINLDGLVEESNLDFFKGNQKNQSSGQNNNNQGQNNQGQGNNNNGQGNQNGENNNQTDEEKQKQVAAETLKAEAVKLGLPETSTQADIDAKKASQQGAGEAKAVVIDDVEYKIDDQGNAITQDGKVFKTKAEIEQMSAEGNDEEANGIDEYIKLGGIHPTDDKGKPKKYEDTFEGFIELNNDISLVKARKIFQEQVDSVPGARQYLEYLRRGGNPVDYHKQMSSSWKAVKFDPKNTDMLTNAVVASLVKGGMSEEKAKSTAKLYADTNQLEEMGKESYKTLVDSENARDEQRNKAYEAEIEAENKSLEDHWKKVNEVIKAGAINVLDDKGKVLNSITIPEAERDTFFKYLAAPVDKERNSQSILDNEKLTNEQWLQLEYLKWKKFDLSKLVTMKANTLKVEGIKKRFSTKQTGLGGGHSVNQNQYQKQGSPDLNEITVDNLTSTKT